MDIAAALAYLTQRERPLDVQADLPRPAATRPERSERGPRSAGRDEGRPRAPRDGDRGAAPGREGSRDRPRPQARGSEGLTSYRIEVGHQHGATPREIVGAIANESGLEGRYIGRIDIRDDHSLVDLPEGMPREIFNHLKRVYVRGQALRISLADGAAGGTRRSEGENPGGARPDQPSYERKSREPGFHQERRRKRTDPS
jgi:ATP-dependent RNA helicase DeaD